MRDYELTLVVDPEISPAKQKALTEKVKKFVKDLKGEMADLTSWGKKELSYPIKKHQTGAFFFAPLQIPSSAPSKLNQILRVEENLLRYLLVKTDSVKPAQAKPKKS